MSELLDPLLLYLDLSQDRGIIVSIDCGPNAPPLRPLVQALLPWYPDLVVTHDPAVLGALPRGSVVLLCLGSETLTQDGRWLDLNRQRVEDRALRVILWCARTLAQLLAQAAPHFSDWIAHHLVYPAAWLQPPAHAVLGLRALVRARVPGAQLAAPEHNPAILVRAALPRWRYQRIEVDAYEDLLRQLQRDGEARLLHFFVGSERDQQRLRWALAESGWRRPCLITSELQRPPSWWRLHDAYMPLAEASRALTAAPRPGVLAVLLGLEPEAILLCARLLNLGADAQALATELFSAPDPGAAVANRLAAMGQVHEEQVARGEASPPELRALACRPQVRRRRSGLPQDIVWGDANAALHQGDIALALRMAEGGDAAKARSIEQAVRARIRQQIGAPAQSRGAAHLCLLHAPADQARADEFARVLRLLDGVREVSLRSDESIGDVLVPLLSADLLAYEPLYRIVASARRKKTPLIPVLLRPCLWDWAEELRDLAVLPSDERAVTAWPNPDDAWMEVLRGIAARLPTAP